MSLNSYLPQSSAYRRTPSEADAALSGAAAAALHANSATRARDLEFHAIMADSPQMMDEGLGLYDAPRAGSVAFVDEVRASTFATPTAACSPHSVHLDS
jgi:hypothetical protein